MELVRGLAFPKPFLVPKVVEDLIDYKPCDKDIFIVTYPKCGTTWTQFLVWEIMHKGAVPPSPNQIMFKHIPFMEYIGIEHIQTLPEPRVMKTHLPFHLQPYSPSSKYIYVIRNPWDCCVSYYYHHCLDSALPFLSFDAYFKLFITGELAWGDFFDHVLSWHAHRNEPNVLFLTYEEMKKDTRKTLFEIARFLGESYYESLQDEEVVENCLKHSDFKYLKEMGMFFLKPGDDSTDSEAACVHLGEIDRSNAKDDPNIEEVKFFRKGVVGDWRNHFSQDQIKDFNEYLTIKLKGTEMEGFWKPIEK